MFCMVIFIHPQHCTLFRPVQFRLISLWKQLTHPGSSRIGNEPSLQAHSALDNSRSCTSAQLPITWQCLSTSTAAGGQNPTARALRRRLIQMARGCATLQPVGSTNRQTKLPLFSCQQVTTCLLPVAMPAFLEGWIHPPLRKLR